MSTLKKAEKTVSTLSINAIATALKARETNVVKNGLPESDLIRINNIGDGT